MNVIDFFVRIEKNSDLSLGDYIENAKNIDVFTLNVNETIVPCTVNNNNKECYLVSPSVHYIKYAMDEISEMSNKLLLFTLKCIGKTIYLIGSFGCIDKAVHVNNWLISTNPNVRLDQDQVKLITKSIKDKHPCHSIIFRSIDPIKDCDLIKYLVKEGYHLVLNREIHYFYPNKINLFTKNKKKMY
ncbi:hypothetical protein [Spartinivicinus poritis]|uniref:Uncharacterized protein n=1 Tax=Spartinivicinus poritis TaxID=2994640 RepID=A0ABT5UGS9_9GAMM|nr:hypothetical protein [Spartinivicinus sp. A2-2]MDE1465589.1 hypothetical protein [Spartinivicinus sp. A2-2]